MLKKLVLLAITSGLAAKAYRSWQAKQSGDAAQQTPVPAGGAVRRKV